MVYRVKVQQADARMMQEALKAAGVRRGLYPERPIRTFIARCAASYKLA